MNIFTKLYNKDKLTFALVLIGAYVFFASAADALSEAVGVSKIATLPFLVFMSALLYIWLCRNGLKSEFGLSSVKCKSGELLYFIPLCILITANLWNGVNLDIPIPDTFLYIFSMLLVGFLEELIFRGFLFRALCETGLKKAFVISSFTFGIGHIVNLFNGAELYPTLLQIVSAVAIGFLFTLVFYKSKSLLPCIITHGIFNSLSAFSLEPDIKGKILMCAAISAIAVLYSIYIARTIHISEK